MEPKERRQIGAHYTSERDILKLINSLFMDDLRAEFEKIKENKNRLREFQEKLGALKFLDPACGCGNFLVVTYREIRLLELDVINILYKGQQVTSVEFLLKVDVDSMHGIEINEFPALIAEVAMWLIDHQMNQRLSEAFGKYYVRLPLRKSAKIVLGNALRLDWNEVIKPSECSYILGNPPFVGKKEKEEEQRKDLIAIWGDINNGSNLDYVTCWYRLAAKFIANSKCEVGFVSTNSICQGEQVSILWGVLLNKYTLAINFAHRTFAWESEVKGKAHVHCVIVGFGEQSRPMKKIYEHDAKTGKQYASIASNISPYLVEGSNIVISKKTKPICSVPIMDFGSKAADFGFLTLSPEETKDLTENYPKSKNWIKQFIGSYEFINNKKRYCLWLKDVQPEELRDCLPVMDRLEKCRKARLASVDQNTRRWAAYPALFQADRQPQSEYLLFPKVSSERRQYVPLGFLPPEIITNPTVLVVPNAQIYHYGILSSSMHMDWMRQVCGRMKSDYQYSNTIVYNNFPWPQSPTEAQKAKVEAKAQAVLDARAAYPDASLADLYDPLTMPAILVKAHSELDRAVEQCYRAKPFASDRERVEFLFALYEKLFAPLQALLETKVKGKKKS